MLSLTMVRRSACSAAISSRIGATCRHGPHHSAQKSTITGLSLLRTSASKVASVTDLIAPTEFSPSVSWVAVVAASVLLASQRSASSDAAQPVPAAVIAWR